MFHPIVAEYLHTLNPFALHFPAGFPIEGVRWYGLSYLAAFAIGYLLIRRIATVGISTLKPPQVGDYIISTAMGVVLGGRIGYVLFYKPSLLVHFYHHLPFWALLAINEGGMASHGGMIGGVLGLLYFSYTDSQKPKEGHNWAFLADLFAFGAPLGLFFGRLANFVNGELIGRPCSPTLPWAVKFPQEMYQWDAENLQKASEKLIPLLPADLQYSHDWITAVMTQLQQGNLEMAQAIPPLLTPRHPSQLYEALLEGIVLFSILLFAWRKPQKPGVVGSIFCTSYGIVRILCEFFREPDAHLHNSEFAWLHITRGQWLSAAVNDRNLDVVVFSHRPTVPAGSWRVQKIAPVPAEPAGSN